MSTFHEELITIEELKNSSPEEVIDLQELGTPEQMDQMRRREERRRKNQKEIQVFRLIVFLSEPIIVLGSFLFMLLLPGTGGLLFFLPLLFGPYFLLGLVAWAAAPAKNLIPTILFIVFNGIGSIWTLWLLRSLRGFNFY